MRWSDVTKTLVFFPTSPQGAPDSMRSDVTKTLYPRLWERTAWSFLATVQDLRGKMELILMPLMKLFLQEDVRYLVLSGMVIAENMFVKDGVVVLDHPEFTQNLLNLGATALRASTEQDPALLICGPDKHVNCVGTQLVLVEDSVRVWGGGPVSCQRVGTSQLVDSCGRLLEPHLEEGRLFGGLLDMICVSAM